MTRLFQSGGHSFEAAASASVLPMNIQHWSPLGSTGLITLQSRGLSRVFSNTTIKKHQFFGTQPSLWSNSHIPTWLLEKPFTLTFVEKVLSLLLNTLSRFVVAFLPRDRCLLISCLQSPSTVTLEPKKIKSVTVSIISPSISHEVMGLDALILCFWMLSFKPAFSLYSFTFIKRLFSSSLLSAIKVVSSAYLRLLIFLPAILIPARASPSPAVHMMYSAYKLNKQGDNIQPWHTPFPVWNQSLFPCPVLTIASWSAYRRQVRWSGIPISLRIFQFVMIHTKVWHGQ